MTKKDYELIASSIEAVYNDKDLDKYKAGISEVAYNIAEGLQYDNPRFDRNKFLKACGIDVGPTAFKGKLYDRD
jgi:hypothetical protein